jgi:hypothetical protein
MFRGFAEARPTRATPKAIELHQILAFACLSS